MGVASAIKSYGQTATPTAPDPTTPTSPWLHTASGLRARTHEASMTAEQLRALQPGDIIRHKHAAEAMVVTANYGSRVTAVRTVDVTNPIEWDRIAQHEAR